ncbi:MAG: ATP-binding protein [Streptosporangiaceae bacterium]
MPGGRVPPEAPAALPAGPRSRPVRMPVLRVLPGTPESAGVARALARQVLGDTHPALETVLLVVSELVTNAILHSQSGAVGGTVLLALCPGPAGVLVQVRDNGGPWRPLELVRPGIAADHGYGLVLVDALADSWGTLASTQGRVTWCRISATRETKV